MAEHVCLMLTLNSENMDMLRKALELGTATVDLNKHTVLYLDESWYRYAKAGVLEKSTVTRNLAVQLRDFLNAGGQLWVSPSKPGREPLIEGAIVVDNKTLMTFLTQDTVVLTF